MRLFSSFFLVAEALGTLGLWFVLWRDPSTAASFLPEGVPADLVHTFLAADLLTFVVLPLAGGHGIFHRCSWTAPVLWLHAGGVLYAALWAGWAAATTGSGAIAAVALVPLALVALLIAWRGAPSGE